MKSNSKFLNYINVLLHDDDALNAYLFDPITNAKDAGLVKAERAVLRRTLTCLSTNSVNGYSILREISSFRNSLRLLRNVLINFGTKMIQDHRHHLGLTMNNFFYSASITLPMVLNDKDFTCKTNEDVEQFPHTSIHFQIELEKEQVTVEELMDKLCSQYDLLSYEKIKGNSGGHFVKSITYNDLKITADLSSSCYDLTENPDADFVFWFYNCDVAPNKQAKEPINSATIQSGQTLHWQLLAPNAEYGFKKCHPSYMNKYYNKDLHYRSIIE